MWVLSALQELDQSESAEPEKTGPLQSTLTQDGSDSKSNETEDQYSKQSPPDLDSHNTEKVKRVKCRLCVEDSVWHIFRSKRQEVQAQVQEKMKDRSAEW